jgi:hypothetical protein
MAESRKRTTSGSSGRGGKRGGGGSSSGRDDAFEGKTPAELRDALARNLIRPLELVMLSRERIQEAVDDAVRRGRMTADDAEELVRGLLERGRRQTNDVLRDLEQMLGRGGGEARPSICSPPAVLATAFAARSAAAARSRSRATTT